MRKILILFLLPTLCLLAQNQRPGIESPEEIQQELDEAEAEFNRALQMFNPWYTGPLITPSASMMPVGQGNMQPYLFFTENYARYNSQRNSVSLGNHLFHLEGDYILQTGMTQTTDLTLNLQGVANWQGGSFGGGYGDTSLVLGFLIHKQTPYTPQVKFTITQYFPTGKYKNLSTNGLGLNATGSGAYSTQFGLALGKLFFWSTQHPLNTRIFFGYQLSTTVHVKEFNSYGGGFGTNGTVRPGNQISADLGLELSLTQHWVLATDLVYTATHRTKFHGTPGTLADGTAATNTSGYSDNLSLAPAIEYNFSSKMGLIAGLWFSVYGRNSLDYISGVISLTYSFP